MSARSVFATRVAAACLVVGACAGVVMTSALNAQTPMAGSRSAAAPSPPSDPLAIRIGLSLVDEPIQDALAVISERAHLRLTYSSDDIATARHVSLTQANISVGAALDTVLAHSGLHPIVMADGGVVLTSASRSAAGDAQRNTTGDSSGTLTGVLAGRDDGQPVQYGTVLLIETGVTRFTDAEGRFRLTRLSPGTYTVRARQIGYAPVNVTVHVESAPSVTAVTIRMVHLPPILDLVTVKGRRSNECVATGVPDSTVDPRLAAIFAQARENVDRFRLVLEEYPFRFTREERVVLRLEPGGDSTEWIDSVSYESRAHHPYHVGGIIFVESGIRVLSEILPRKGTVAAGQESAEEIVHVLDHDIEHHVRKVARDSLGDSSYALRYSRRYMYLPTFRDLADSVFLSAHCFSYGGTRSLRGTSERLIRVDFRPAASISAPDVEGSIYLDAERYVVRRAVFEMTKPGAADPPLLGVSVTTTFRELVPLVPVFDSVRAVQPLRDLFGGQGPVMRVQLEDDRILTFTFETESPGEQSIALLGFAEDPPTETRLIPSGHKMLVATRDLQVVTTPPSPNSGASTRPDTLGIAVEGRVVRTDGTPVEGATVGVLFSSDSAATNDSGRFVLRNVPPGIHMLWARAVGFEPARVPVTLSATRARTLTVTLTQAVPVLARIVTTEHYPPGYSDVGLDKRIQAGLGEFMTLPQIQSRHASKFTDLLRLFPSLVVRKYPRSLEVSVMGARGLWGFGTQCVGYVLDGVMQDQLSIHTSAGTPAIGADDIVDPAEIGAIEVYQTSDRPAGYEAVGQQCVLVVIWTRGRLGLTDADTTLADSRVGAHSPQTAAGHLAESVGTAVFPTGGASACTPPAPIDTTTFTVYAVLGDGLAGDGTDTAWTSYSARVLDAFARSFALPSPLALPVFGYASPALTRANLAPRGLAAAPMLFGKMRFTLDPTGTLLESSIVTSSLSGDADTSLLAAVQGAAAHHLFPSMPRTGPHRDSAPFTVLVSTIASDSTHGAVVVDRIALPEWPIARAAALTGESQPNLAALRGSATTAADSALLEIAVDENGEAITSTVRAISRTASGAADPTYRAFVGRVAQLLPEFQFAPALVGTCAVKQVVLQSFAD
jgi:hypothetical protein